MNKLWVDKYAPNTMEELVLDEDMKKMFKDFISKNTIPNLLFAAKPGVGKDSTIGILLKELNADVLKIDCAISGNVDAVRNKIKIFCEAMSMGELKVVWLREADRMSPEAQNSMRNIIEDNSSDTRFFLSCNYLNKILSPIQSRCQHISPKANVKDILKRVIHILKTEEIEYEQDVLKEFIDTIIKTKKPDIRIIINILQSWCSSGILTNVGIVDSEEISSFCIKLLNMKTPKLMRKHAISNEDVFSNDYEILTGNLFNVLDNPEHQILCADYLYRMSQVIDKEIQFYALLLEIKN